MNLEQTVAFVNDVPLNEAEVDLDEQSLRQRACTELLRQAAIASELLAVDDPVPAGGVISEQASLAIEKLLADQLQVPVADEQACQRYYEANPARFESGERVTMRHILFAVTPGVDVAALRQRAEACLIDLRCESPGESDRFSQVAAELSNCPSGAEGGRLGCLQQADCAAEFAREIFGQSEVGVLPRLIHSRFGFHVVEVLRRDAGTVPPYDQVRAAVDQALHRQGFATALRQYLQVLAGEARIVGVDLDSGTGMLVQ